MGRDFEPGRKYTQEEIFRGVQSVIPSIEIIDTRFSNAVNVFSAVADNANSGALILSQDEFDLGSFDRYANVKTRLIVDNVSVATGTTANVLGNPLNSLVWLINTVTARNIPVTR